MKIARRSQADLLLIFLAVIWGLTFSVVKNALTEISPFFFNSIRFTIAFFFLLLFCWQDRKAFNKTLVLKGFLLGIIIFGGYSLQTIGLIYTSAANSGFISGLAVVIVPLLMIAVERRLPSPYVILGVTSATIGLALLSLETNLTFNFGDLLTLSGAFCFALQIVLIGKYANSFPTLPFVTVQIGTVALASTLAGLAAEPLPSTFSYQVWGALLITAIPATALAFIIQNWAQRFTTPTRTAIILALEPVFGMVFAIILLGEIFTNKDLIGAFLMLTGMLLAELKEEDKEKIKNKEAPA